MPLRRARRAQFDNGGPFVAPTGIGEVVRVLVHQGVTPVLVPPREPWRNGTIEHFNDTLRQALLPPRALQRPRVPRRACRRV
jgi:hypothetical protein